MTPGGDDRALTADLDAPLRHVLAAWAAKEAGWAVSEPALGRAPAILAATDAVLGDAATAELAGAFAAGDDRARAAVCELERAHAAALEPGFARTVAARSARDWWRALALGQRTVAAARGAGDADFAVRALILVAKTARTLDRQEEAIAAYEEAIAIGRAVLPDAWQLLSTAYDNVGNVYRDLGRYDEALARYTAALQLERDAATRLVIGSNRAIALLQLGEERAAGFAFDEALAAAEAAGTAPLARAIALDNTGDRLLVAGDAEGALARFEAAQPLLAAASAADRATNARGRASALLALDLPERAGAAFVEAWELLLADAREATPTDHYAAGHEASAGGPRPSAETLRRAAAAEELRRARRYADAVPAFAAAETSARTDGAIELALNLAGVAAATLRDARAYDEAVPRARAVAEEAAARGLALSELFAVGTLAALGVDGADAAAASTLALIARVCVLRETQVRVLEAAGEHAAAAAFANADVGIDSLLGGRAVAARADALAVACVERTVAVARAGGNREQLVARLVLLREARTNAGDDAGVAAVVAELEAEVATGTLSEPGETLARVAIAEVCADAEPARAIGHLERATELLELRRGRQPPGARRSEVLRSAPTAHRLLAALLRRSGAAEASFDALQGGKERALVDELAAASGGDVHDDVVGAAEVRALLAGLGGGAPTTLVDLAIEAPEGVAARIVSREGVTTCCEHVDIAALGRADRSDVGERRERLVAVCEEDAGIARLVAAIDAAVPAGDRLLLVPDGPLHNLPLHLAPVAGRPWCDVRAIGYLPAAGALRFVAARRAPLGRALVAGDSRGDLPGARAECVSVATSLGTTALLGPACSAPALVAALRSSTYDIVHLAVHGRADVRVGGRASLLLGDGAGGTTWVAFEELAAAAEHAHLLVLSGCSTALAGVRHGRDLKSLSRAAVAAGAGAVVACLWPVGDVAAGRFMEAFYARLVADRAAGSADLRDALAAGRGALRDEPAPPARHRDGRDVAPELPAGYVPAPSDPARAATCEWSAFVVLGDPVLEGGSEPAAARHRDAVP